MSPLFGNHTVEFGVSVVLFMLVIWRYVSLPWFWALNASACYYYATYVYLFEHNITFTRMGLACSILILVIVRTIWDAIRWCCCPLRRRQRLRRRRPNDDSPDEAVIGLREDFDAFSAKVLSTLERWEPLLTSLVKDKNQSKTVA